MNPGRQVEFQAWCGHLTAARAGRAGRDVRCPSESELVTITPLWLFPIPVGLYGPIDVAAPVRPSSAGCRSPPGRGRF